MAELVEKKVAEAAQQVVDFTKRIQHTTVEEVGEILKAQMQVKREQGCSVAAASDASVTKSGNNVIHNTLSNLIDLDPPSSSPSHKSSNLDDVHLSTVYSNLQKYLTPTPSTNPKPKPDDVSKEYDPLVVKPL